jgi:hypothetical protein
MMVTIVWNPFGFHLLNALPKGTSVTGGTTVTISFHPSSRCAQHGRRDDSVFMGIMRGSTPCKNIGISVEKMVCGSSLIYPAPPHDLAPSDFFLFGHIIKCLARTTFASRDELFEGIRIVMMEIPMEIYQ